MIMVYYSSKHFISSPDDSMTVTFVSSGAANPITTQIDVVCPSGVAGTDPFRLIIATEKINKE